MIAEILQQFIARLISKIAHLGQQNCLATENPVPEIFPPGDFFVTASEGPQSFPEPFTAGGGSETLVQRSTILVTIFRRCHLDQPTHLAAALFDRSRGLLTLYKPAILSALLIERCGEGSIKIPWEPVDASGRRLLRDQHFPTGCTAPRPVTLAADESSWIGITLTFSVLADWQLDG